MSSFPAHSPPLALAWIRAGHCHCMASPGLVNPPCALLLGAPLQLPWTGQWAEDEWIYNRLFHNKRGGFYVEMGAMVGVLCGVRLPPRQPGDAEERLRCLPGVLLPCCSIRAGSVRPERRGAHELRWGWAPSAQDGVKLSNTLWLHQAAGWRGLLIEACPSASPLAQRPHAHHPSTCLARAHVPLPGRLPGPHVGVFRPACLRSCRAVCQPVAEPAGRCLCACGGVRQVPGGGPPGSDACWQGWARAARAGRAARLLGWAAWLRAWAVAVVPKGHSTAPRWAGGTARADAHSAEGPPPSRQACRLPAQPPSIHTHTLHPTPTSTPHRCTGCPTMSWAASWS